MKLSFSEIGSGFPVIFLHGFPFGHHLWDPLHEHLDNTFHHIFPDLRGFGGSPIVEPGFSMEGMAQDVLDLINQNHVDNYILVGHSMGGYIALEMMRQRQSGIKGIALLASHIYADEDNKRQARLDMIEKLETDKPSEVLKDMPTKLSAKLEIQEYCVETLAYVNTHGIQGALYAMAYRQSSEDVWNLNTLPKLLLEGKKDNFISEKMYRSMNVTGRNVTHEIIDDAGHMLMREYPAQTAEIINKFIQSIRR